MTQISTSSITAPTIQSGVTANNGQPASDGTQSVKGHHHHAGSSTSASDSFSALMNLIGSPADDGSSSAASSDSSSDSTATSPFSDLASLDTSPLTANDVSNAPSPNDPSAILRAMRHYAVNNSPDAYGTSTVSQAA